MLADVRNGWKASLQWHETFALGKPPDNETSKSKDEAERSAVEFFAVTKPQMLDLQP
jgi:hypothetical protein